MLGPRSGQPWPWAARLLAPEMKIRCRKLSELPGYLAERLAAQACHPASQPGSLLSWRRLIIRPSNLVLLQFFAIPFEFFAILQLFAHPGMLGEQACHSGLKPGSTIEPGAPGPEPEHGPGSGKAGPQAWARAQVRGAQALGGQGPARREARDERKIAE